MMDNLYEQSTKTLNSEIMSNGGYLYLHQATIVRINQFKRVNGNLKARIIGGQWVDVADHATTATGR